MRKAATTTAWLGLIAGGTLLGACGETSNTGSAAQARATQQGPSEKDDATTNAEPNRDDESRADTSGADVAAGLLTVGDAAPPLSAARWFRGEPRDAVSSGRVTLVEFWATWCGPCIAAMPHISELSDRLGAEGLDVVAVSIDRGETAEQVVDAFLEDRVDIVSFEVMLDSGATSRAWLEAAGRSGIPCSFVVAQDGRIAWIGHPMEPASDGDGKQLDRVVEGLLAGTYDIDAQARASDAAAAEMMSAQAEQDKIAGQVAVLSTEMGRLWSAGDRRGVLDYIDQIVALDAGNSHDLAQRKIEILLYELGESEEALDAARALLDDPYKDDSGMMLTIASLFSGAADPGDEGRVFAIETAERVVAMTDGTEPNSLVVLAEAQFASSEFEKAVDTMRGAMTLVGETSPAYSTYELVLSRYLDAAGAAAEPADGPELSAGG